MQNVESVGYSEPHFLVFRFVCQTRSMTLAVGRVVWGLKLDAGNSLEIMGPSHAKGTQNDAKMEAQGCLSEHLGALEGLLGRSSAILGEIFAQLCRA